MRGEKVQCGALQLFYNGGRESEGFVAQKVQRQCPLVLLAKVGW